MKVLLRLPNWLGDLVMSTGLLRALPAAFPGAEVHLIVKKGLDGLLPLLPPHSAAHIFSKDEFKGPRGVWAFGRKLKGAGPFDHYITLPTSFSSALMGYATGARHRTGFRKEGRNFLLTRALPYPASPAHRAEEYMALLAPFVKEALQPQVGLEHAYEREDHIVVNINSEASSRRLTVSKAVELLDRLAEVTDRPLVLIGAPKEAPFTEEVRRLMRRPDRVNNRAGTTSLPELARLLATARALLTTDSGPAHLANAMGTPTVVLFGAGNEMNTAPYRKGAVSVVRLGQLSCEPCLKNICVRYGQPQCLERLDTGIILNTLRPWME